MLKTLWPLACAFAGCMWLACGVKQPEPIIGTAERQPRAVVDGGVAVDGGEAEPVSSDSSDGGAVDDGGVTSQPAKKQKPCRPGAWRPFGTSEPCRRDPDRGPRTCGHAATGKSRGHCCCRADDLMCHLKCGAAIKEDRHWRSPAPPLERADCKSKCNNGRPWACYKLGVTWIDWHIKSKRFRAALRYFDRACALGLSEACSQLAKYVKDDDVARLSPNLRRWAVSRCDGKRRRYRACRVAGAIFEQGWGVSPDVDRAREFYRRDCEYGARTCGGPVMKCWYAKPSCEALKRLGGTLPTR